MSDDPATSLTHRVGGTRWTFDETVAGCFDDMLARSIPAYADMRKLTTRLAIRAARPDSTVLDLGCSLGAGLEPLTHALMDSRFVGLEVAPEMAKRARAKFAADPRVSIRSHDLRDGLPLKAKSCSVVLSILTLQFVPVEHRPALLRETARVLRPGGVLILVEKCLLSSPNLGPELVGAYHGMKIAAGYTPEQVDEKARALENVLVPLPAETNERLLIDAGFGEVERIWQALAFVGWIAVKSGLE